MKPMSPHWADQTAARIIRRYGEKDSYTVASGITPSGTVHIGNFREVFTVDLVARGLRSLGKQVRFIYSWDDFDTFRKVPVNLPNQEMLKTHLRRPISRVPDAHGQSESYAAYNERVFESEITQMGIHPEFLYQHERYSSGMYAEGIKRALEQREAVKAILNQHRSSPLEDDWLPTAIYCEQCDRDEMVYERYPGGWDYQYKCASCGNEATTDIRTTKNLKLNWRTDWPMRWAFEKVEFEPGGKDHSSEGGSFDTAKNIVEALWQWPAPEYLQYDFVSIKGDQRKMSSSAGTLYTLSDALNVYDPQLIRWLFASQRPNHDFSIAFDQDVIKTYDEFDRAEKIAFAPEGTDNKWPMIRRTYELSLVSEEIPEKPPFRAPFRELCNRLQIFDGDIKKTRERYYSDFVITNEDLKAFDVRCQKAWNWLSNFAPEEFRYRLNAEPADVNVTETEAKALTLLRSLVDQVDLDAIDAKDLNQKIYDDVIHGSGVDSKEFFTLVYRKLISRDKGPRLPSFVKEIGRERLLKLL